MDIDKELKDKTKTINNCCNDEIEEPDHDNEWENLIEDLEDLISDSEMNLYCFEEMEDEEEKENEKDYTFEDLLNYCTKIIRNTEGIDMNMEQEDKTKTDNHYYKEEIAEKEEEEEEESGNHTEDFEDLGSYPEIDNDSVKFQDLLDYCNGTEETSLIQEELDKEVANPLTSFRCNKK